MSISLALDALMIVLLGVTIAYAAVLNRRLAAWRNDKAELEKMIDRFNRAAQHADVGISTLKEASEETGRLHAITEQIIHLEEDTDTLNHAGIKALFKRHRSGNAMD